MVRTLVIAAVAVVVLFAGIGAVLYMAYGISDRPPASANVAGLGDSSSVVFYRNGAAEIRASSREDAYVSLGYLHGQEHAWSMSLWRQTAVGELSEWFGGDLLPLDRLTRRLRLGGKAREAYASLLGDEKMVLDAYSRGVSAAFESRRSRMANELVLLDTNAEAWEPWHSLAVERLFAWVSASRPDPDSLRHAPEAVRDFFEADRFLRQWLHLHGFENGVMWAMRDSTGTRFVQRHVYGASALPIFHEVRLGWPGTSTHDGATLIGTPYMPVGRTESHAWGILMSGSVALSRAQRDTSNIPLIFDRIRTSDGREHLLRLRSGRDELFFPLRDQSNATLAVPDTTRVPGAPSEMSSDTTSQESPYPAGAADTSATLQLGWVLRWSGLESLSDAAAWISLPDEPGGSFGLIEGDGMTMSRDGSVGVRGTPQVVVPVNGGQLIGNSDWATYAAERLDSLIAPDIFIETLDLISDRQSAWAAGLAPPLTDAAIAVPQQPHLVTEALTYLRNWDFAYDRASIAASIFDRWMTVFQDSLGQIPDSEVPDSALAEHLVRYETLVQTIDMLARDYGEDPSAWRWEVVEPHRYYFPAWSADTLLSDVPEFRANSRYASIEVPGSGHPTTLAFGPSSLAGRLDAPATWESWISTDSWDAFRFRRRQFPANRFFGRYLVSDRPPEPSTIEETSQPHYTIELIPE